MGNRIILKFLNDLKIIKFRYIDYYKNSFFIFIFIMKNNKEEVIEKKNIDINWWKRHWKWWSYKKRKEKLNKL